MSIDIYKEKVVSIRDIIFDINTICDGKPILYSDDDIQELNKVIVNIEIHKSKALEIENIQLVEDAKIDKSISTITYQTNHKEEYLDINLKNQKNKLMIMISFRNDNNILLLLNDIRDIHDKCYQNII